MAFYVFDLDGTLADCSHRLHFLEAKDWRGFFAACVDDAPIPHMIGLFQALNAEGLDHRLEVWSGRSDEVRGETLDWLGKHGVFVDALLMRTAGDHRSDDEVKRDFLRGGGVPDLIFDDRARVVQMWRAEGIPCAQVADGNF